jgi:hypothetical protein
MRQRPFSLFVLALVAVALVGRPSRAGTLDRATAEADAQAAIADGQYVFCSEPSRPLSPRALRMCPLAGELSECEGFAKACAAETAMSMKPLEPPSWRSSAIAKAMHYLAVAAFWLAGLGAVIAIVAAVVRLVRSAKDDAPGEVAPDTATGIVLPAPVARAGDAEQLLRAAAVYAERGSLDLALFTYLGAALRALDDRGAIRLARYHTHGEYVRGCGDAAARPLLREIVRDVDIVRFGGGGATLEVVERASARAMSIVRAPRPADPPFVPIAMTILLVLFGSCLSACGGGLSRPGADPAGDDLLLDLLVREGVTARHMTGSLASLAMKGREGPAVIVNTERTPLDEGTQAHLLAWVAQGGVLVVAGDADDWPKDLWAKREPATSRDVRVETPCPDDDDACASPRVDHVRLATPAAMTWPHQGALTASAALDSGQLYAAVRPYEKGLVLGLASEDLLTNAGLSVHGNPAGLVALLESLDKTDFLVTRAENGVAPPANPFSGLVRIGLGLGLVHALAFVLLLFLSVGIRHEGPTPTPRPRRRAFAEHVTAIGALYARTHSTGHALRSYAQYADRELRTRAPRGISPALYLAHRAEADPEDTAELYARAMAADDTPRAGDLVILRRLCALFSSVTGLEPPPSTQAQAKSRRHEAETGPPRVRGG